MLSAALPISSLLLGVALLLTGSGLLGTLLALRGGLEGFSDITLGLVMSAYFVGFFLGTFIAPGAVVRVGHIRAFAMFASLASIAAIGHVLVVDPWAWALMRVLTGICLVGLYTVIESWLNAQAPSAQRGQVFAVYMAVNLLAMAGGQYLILYDSPAGFALFGIVSVLFSAALVPVMLTRMTQPQPVITPRLDLRKLHRAAPVGVAGGFGSGLAMGAFWGMGPVLAQRIGLDAAGVAGFMSAVIVGGAVLQWPIGRQSDRGDRRRVLLTVCVLGSLLALLGQFAAVRSLPLLFAAMFLYGGLAFSIYSISVAHLIDRLAPEDILEGSSGLLLVHGVGAALGPALAGLVMNQLGPAALLTYFSAVLVGVAVFIAHRLAITVRDEVHEAGFMPMVRTTPAAFEMMPAADPVPDPESPTQPDSADPATTAPGPP